MSDFDYATEWRRRYRIWRDARARPGTEVPPPGIRSPPARLATAIGGDLLS